MWPLVSRLVSETIVVSLEEVEEAIRMLAGRHRVVVEGAGAISVAAAMRAGRSMGKAVCIVTGGNIDFATLARIVGRHSARLM
jgi:threonine dehydratase